MWRGLIVFALVLGCSLPSLSQANDQQSYRQLDAWLQIDETNRRCGSLYPFEARIINQTVQTLFSNTAESRAAVLASPASPDDPSIAAYNDLVISRRRIAQSQTSELSCDPHTNPLLKLGRSAYLRDLLQLVLIVQNGAIDQQLRPTLKQAFDELARIIKASYGDGYDVLADALAAQNAANPVPARNAFVVLAPYIDDVILEDVTSRRDYRLVPHPTDLQSFEFRKSNVRHLMFDRFQQIRRTTIPLGGAQPAIPVVLTEGVAGDGSIVFAIAFENPEDSRYTYEIKATIFSQDEEVPGLWDRDDWRTLATKYDASPRFVESCPMDRCLVFPPALTERIKERQGRGVSGIPYEIVLAGERAYPLPETQGAVYRKRYEPPVFLK